MFSVRACSPGGVSPEPSTGSPGTGFAAEPFLNGGFSAGFTAPA
jgi:hypothetical protein